MKLLVLGASGQVGQALQAASRPPGLDMVFHDRRQTDVTDRDALRRAVDRAEPDALINLAAYTAVDAAEDNPDLARRINGDGAGMVAQVCAASGIWLVHISTDYVFDGRAATPYPHTSLANPCGIYGESKAQGEQAVRAVLAQHIILRTSWVFGCRGSNFVRTILGLLGERDELRIIDDQTACPTAAEDLADCLIKLAQKDVDQLAWGTHHFCGREPVTWYGFAQQIAALKRRHRPDSTVILPITTSAYGQRAQRPAYSVLDCASTMERLELPVPTWHGGLARVVDFWLQETASGSG